jgi:hypothetical protein
MDYDLNSSINLKTTLNIPRSISKTEKEKEKSILSIRKKSNKKSISNSITRRNSTEKVYKNSLDTNIQVHIRVI